MTWLDDTLRTVARANIWVMESHTDQESFLLLVLSLSVV